MGDAVSGGLGAERDGDRKGGGLAIAVAILPLFPSFDSGTVYVQNAAPKMMLFHLCSGKEGLQSGSHTTKRTVSLLARPRLACPLQIVEPLSEGDIGRLTF